MSAFDWEVPQAYTLPSSPCLSPSPSSPNPTWESRYEELLRWRAEKGDTCVPKAEGALGRWVARQRELKRTGKLGADREEKLNAINFVWNTVTAMWEERFRRLSEWKKIHGHCAVPIAQGELGTWVSKQRQLRKRGKLSKEKVDALDSLEFTWSTAEADWEDKFKRLCEWTRERGHASVPFNEGELGWWVNTQRQCKRKGKLSPAREERLEALGFVWNPSTSRSRTSHSNVMLSSADTTPSLTPEKSEKDLLQDADVQPILQLFDGRDGFTSEDGSPVSAEMGTECSADHILSQNIWSPTFLSSPLLPVTSTVQDIGTEHSVAACSNGLHHGVGVDMGTVILGPPEICAPEMTTEELSGVGTEADVLEQLLIGGEHGSLLGVEGPLGPLKCEDSHL